jgi:hypothetical protein
MKRVALLTTCPKCCRVSVPRKKIEGVQNNIKYGAKHSPLRHMCACGNYFHMNSKYGTHVHAAVDARRPNQVKRLQEIADEVNKIVEGQEWPCHTFQLEEIGRRLHGKEKTRPPFKRWQKFLEDYYPLEALK